MVDPRGNYVYSATLDAGYTYIAVTAPGTTPVTPSYLPTNAGPGNTVNVCSGGGLPLGLSVSPDGNRLFVVCQNDPNNYVDVWDVSQSDGKLLGADTITSPKASVTLPPSVGATGLGTPAAAENGCTTPFGISSKLTTSAFGTRVFVSCMNSDTVISFDYNTGSGTNTPDTDSFNPVISTDATTITNVGIGNTGATYTNYACNNGGSCPQLLDLEPNPAIHFTTGGYAPTPPFALPAASVAAGSYQYYVVAQGGAVPRTFSETTAAPVLVGAGGTGACQNLSLASNGLISGTPTNTGTCGPFTIRVTDGSVPGQFVERTFTLTVGP